MEDDILIKIKRHSTGQQMSVFGKDATDAYAEIKKSLSGEKLSNNVGLLGSDFVIEIIIDNKKTENYAIYFQGKFLMDSHNLYSFKYAEKWYKEFEDELDKILEQDPYHFMKEEKDRKWKINKNHE